MESLVLRLLILSLVVLKQPHNFSFLLFAFNINLGRMSSKIQPIFKWKYYLNSLYDLSIRKDRMSGNLTMNVQKRNSKTVRNNLFVLTSTTYRCA